MSARILKEEVSCNDADSSNNFEAQSEYLQSLEYVNYYDNQIDVLEQPKKEFSEYINLQPDCSLNSKECSENRNLLDKEVKRENTDEPLLLDIKEEDDKLEYQVKLNTERHELYDVLDTDGDTKHSDIPTTPQEIEYKFVQKTVANSIQQSSQWSQNIIIETGHHQDQLNTRHTMDVIIKNKKTECQKRYREQNREKLKHREAERRKRIQLSQSIAGPSTSSDANILEVNNEGINVITALQRKRDYQRRYRERNRDKLKHREAERRRRLCTRSRNDYRIIYFSDFRIYRNNYRTNSNSK